jgi:hypothetical protein
VSNIVVVSAIAVDWKIMQKHPSKMTTRTDSLEIQSEGNLNRSIIAKDGSMQGRFLLKESGFSKLFQDHHPGQQT